MPSSGALPSRLRGRVAFAAALLLLTALIAPAIAQTFPALSGRVVDAANILQPEQRAALDLKLKAHEDKTSDQIVVATVPSLEGVSVEDYANRLYRTWQIGQKAKNNGVLLLVAPKERKVRIEVGYGLEGALTDALSSVIIRGAIAPRFKDGNYAAGINAGIDAILGVVTGDADEWQRRANVRTDSSSEIDWVTIAILLIIFVLVVRSVFRAGSGPGRAHRTGRGSWVVLPVPSGGAWSGGGGWSGGGAFSGGGGSSGGGGASGSW